MPRPFKPFATASHTVEERQEKNRREFSANKLAAVTAQTDTSTPLRYAYDTVDRKKALAEAERRFELEAENARMCARLVAIQEFDSRMVLRPTSVRSSLTLKPGMFYDTVGGSRYQCIDHINMNQLSNPRSLSYAPVVARTAASTPAALACTLSSSLDAADAAQYSPKSPRSRPSSRAGSLSLCPPSPSRGSASVINTLLQQQQQQRTPAARATSGSLRPASSGGVGGVYLQMLSSLSAPTSPLLRKVPRPLTCSGSSGGASSTRNAAVDEKDGEALAAGDAAGVTASPFPNAPPACCRSTSNSAPRVSSSRAGSRVSVSADSAAGSSLSLPLVARSAASAPALPFASLQLARHGSSASAYAYGTAEAAMGGEGAGGEGSLLQGRHAVSTATIKDAYLAGCNLAEAAGGGLKAVRRITASKTAALWTSGVLYPTKGLSSSVELALIAA